MEAWNGDNPSSNRFDEYDDFVSNQDISGELDKMKRESMSHEKAVKLKHTSYTLWGVKLRPGDILNRDQRKQLEELLVTRHSKDAGIRQIIREILDAMPVKSTLTSVEPAEEPQEVADEMTMRAREGLIATGQFPGMEEQVRLGMMDDLPSVQAAIFVQRNMSTAIVDIQKRGHIIRTNTAVTVIPTPPKSGMWNWITRLQHQFVRFMTRYASIKQRNLQLAQQIVDLNRKHDIEINKIKKSMRLELENVAIKALNDKKFYTASSSVSKAVQKFDEVSGNISESSLAAFLNQAPAADRKHLIELAKHALAARKIDPHTNEIVLSMRVPKK